MALTASPGATSSRTSSAPVTPRRSLISPAADFWLLGGASILFCLVFGLGVRLFSTSGGTASVDAGSVYDLALAGFILSFFVNFPHFIASYRLAYGRDRAFRSQHRRELVVVPVLLSGAALFALVLIAASATVGPLTGTSVLGGLALLMFVTVGWHYVKQIYGCVRVTASFDGYQMSSVQMKIIRYGLFPLWVRGLVVVGDATQTVLGIDWQWISAPQWLWTLVNVATAIGAATIVASFVQNWMGTRQMPSWRMVVPLLAIYVWWVPAARFGLVLPLIPFFHSLQYIPFLVKVERSRAEAEAKGDAGTGEVTSGSGHLARWAGSLMLVGAGVFFVIPVIVDSLLGTEQRTGYLAVMAAVTLVINVHHYFIDHVIWRLRDDAHMRALLLN